MKDRDKSVNDLLTKLSTFPAVLEWVKYLYIKEERWSSVDEVKLQAFHASIFEVLDQG